MGILLLWLLAAGTAAAQPAATLDAVPTEAARAVEPSEISVQAASGWQPVGSEFHVDVIAGTAFPLLIGGAIHVEMPYRLQARLDLGWMPPPYLDAINGFLVAIDAYDRATADLVAAAIENSFLLRASVGWRPFEHEGFELAFGYTLATAGGGLSAAEVVQAATSQMVERGSGGEVPMSATIHALHAWLAWAIEPIRYWVLRFAVGFVGTVAASATVGSPCSRPAYCNAQRAAQDYLVDTLTSYVFTPDVQITSGVRF